MKYAYIRVSSLGQSLEVQREQVKKRDPDKIFEEKISGTKEVEDRPKLHELLNLLKSGDILLLTKLDRLGRNLTSLLGIVDNIKRAGASLEVIDCDGMDISGSMGKLLIAILGGVAEFENNMRRERQMEGVLRAKINGVYAARPRKREADKRRNKIAETIVDLRKLGYSAARISKQLKCSQRDIQAVLIQHNMPTERLARSVE